MNLENRKLSLSRLGYYHLSGRRLGSGSFAKVYEGIHRIANEKVAIKTMNITQMTDSYMRKHFKREAELLSRLNHPSIVALFELIETKNHYCIVLEFGGVNLCDYIQTQKRGRLDESSARIMARQLVSAISHMHESNVVHRDIKLENILVNSISKRVKLTDFGLSRSWDRKTMMMTNCGSPEYAAPELHLCLSYGFEVDVWALGVVFFVLVVGRLPFGMETRKPVSSKQRRELLIEETKRGLKTMKHQSFMGSASFLFKDLVSKMINPKRKLRVNIDQVSSHPWVKGVFNETFLPVSETWKKKMFEKYARDFNLTIEAVASEIKTKPYGQLGGIYNIEKHLRQKNTIELKKASSGTSVIKNTLSNNSTAFNRPTTSVAANNLISRENVIQRPKTAHDKPRNPLILKPLRLKGRQDG